MKNIETKIAFCIHVGLVFIGLYTVIMEWLVHLLTDNNIGCIFNALFAF